MIKCRWLSLPGLLEQPTTISEYFGALIFLVVVFTGLLLGWFFGRGRPLSRLLRLMFSLRLGLLGFMFGLRLGLLGLMFNLRLGLLSLMFNLRLGLRLGFHRGGNGLSLRAFDRLRFVLLYALLLVELRSSALPVSWVDFVLRCRLLLRRRSHGWSLNLTWLRRGTCVLSLVVSRGWDCFRLNLA